MPEAAIAPVVDPSPAPAPAPAPVADTAPIIPSGINDAMKQFDEAVRPKPVEKSPEPKEKSPAPAPKSPEPKPAAKDEDIWEKAPGKLKGEYFKTKRQYDEKIEGYEKRIKEIEAKPKEAPGDAKVIQEYQKRISEMEERLSATDYRQSAEFKAKFVDRWTGEYQATVGEVKRLQLTLRDAEGNETHRPATEDDFQKIMRLPPGDQDKAVQELFGPYANRVFARIFRLQEIERASEEAVAVTAKDREVKAKEQQMADQKTSETYDRSYQAAVAELEKQWPEYFAPNDKDPEGTAALQAGQSFVDKALEQIKTGKLSVEDRAAYSAVIRARAAGFQRAEFDRKRFKTENESLKTELQKYRKTDPGALDEGKSGGPAPEAGDEIPAGIDAATSKLKWD